MFRCCPGFASFLPCVARPTMRATSRSRDAHQAPQKHPYVARPTLRATSRSRDAHQAPQKHPYIARPTLRPTKGAKGAHQAPQKHPLHCEAHSACHQGRERRTPGPTTQGRQDITTTAHATRATPTHRVSYVRHEPTRPSSGHRRISGRSTPTREAYRHVRCPSPTAQGRSGDGRPHIPWQFCTPCIGDRASICISRARRRSAR